MTKKYNQKSNLFPVNDDAPAQGVMIVVSKPDGTHVVLNADVPAPLTIESMVEEKHPYCVKTFDVPSFLHVGPPQEVFEEDPMYYVSVDIKLCIKTFEYYTEHKAVTHTPQEKPKYDKFSCELHSRSLAELASKLDNGLYRIFHMPIVDELKVLEHDFTPSCAPKQFDAYVFCTDKRATTLQVMRMFPKAFVHDNMLAVWHNNQISYHEHCGSGYSVEVLSDDLSPEWFN